MMIELSFSTGPYYVQVSSVSASVSNTGQEQHSLAVVMKRLQNITIKRSRGTFNKLSIINKMRATVNASNKRFKADLLKTDVITSGSTAPDNVPGADGETCVKCVLAWPEASSVAQCACWHPPSHFHGDAVVYKQYLFTGLCFDTMRMHRDASSQCNLCQNHWFKLVSTLLERLKHMLSICFVLLRSILAQAYEPDISLVSSRSCRTAVPDRRHIFTQVLYTQTCIVQANFGKLPAACITGANGRLLRIKWERVKEKAV